MKNDILKKYKVCPIKKFLTLLEVIHVTNI